MGTYSEPRGIALYVSIGGREAVPFQFDTDVVTVGRSEQADLRIDRPMLSRNQFSVERDPDGRFYLVPEQTTNPTRLNGSPVRQPAQLADGDVIEIGDVQLHVGIEGEAPGEAQEDAHYDALDQMRGRSSPRQDAYVPEPRAPTPPPRTQSPPPRTQSKRPIVLGVFAGLFCIGILAWGFMGQGEDEDDLGGKSSTQNIQLVRPEPPPSCEPSECVERAKRTFELALNLEARAESDPSDLYRAAVNYERAEALVRASGAGPELLPNLGRRQKAARDRLDQWLREAKFRYSMARKNKNTRKALQELDYLLRLIADEEHPFRKRILASRRRLESELK